VSAKTTVARVVGMAQAMAMSDEDEDNRHSLSSRERIDW